MARMTWGALAENRDVQSRGAEDSARRDGGYRVKSSDERRRGSMPNGRGSSKGWEVRLGAPQVVIWLGLAIGASVGAYFVGFFSGQSVGFESARSASGVEVAKLAIRAELPERSAQNVSAIYDKLNAPALMDEAPKAPVEAKGKKDAEPEPAAVRITKEIKAGEVGRNDDQPASPPAVGSGDSNPEVDLFDFEASSSGQQGDATSDGDASGSTVRFLGAKVDGAPESSDKTLGAILEERLERARSDARKSAPGELKQDSQPAKVELPKVESPKVEVASDAKAGAKVEPKRAEQKGETSSEAKQVAAKEKVADLPKPVVPVLPDPGEAAPQPKTDSNFVKRIVPQGYFAQVAAPKNLSDAESVARKLKRSGFPVVVEVANVRGEEYFRVLVGPEQNRVHADRLVEQLQSERYLSAPPFIRQVK